MSYFIFKNKSSADIGPLKQLPYAVKAERSMTITEMPYGIPIVTTSGMKTGKLTFCIGLRNREDIDELYAWLNGSGRLQLSDDLTKYYNAYCSGPLIPNYLSKRLGEVNVTFVIEPYRYAISNDSITPTLTIKPDNTDLKDCNLTYNGTAPGEPIIKLTGSGLLKLWVNHNELQVENVTSHITVDVQTLRVKDESGNIILNKTIGDPTRLQLNPGNNYIEVSNNVTSVEITKNERWY